MDWMDDGGEALFSRWLSFAQEQWVVRCPPGHLIYLQDTRASCCYYLKQGRVKIFLQSESGDERILRVCEAGAVLGAAAFFDGLPRVSSAVALTHCELVPIDRALVEREFARDPRLAMDMIRSLARAVRNLSGQVDDMAFSPASRRIARHLLRLCGDGTAAAATQEEIAAAVSASRVTVGRLLSEFARKGWISTGYGKITLLNRGALEAEAG